MRNDGRSWHGQAGILLGVLLLGAGQEIAAGFEIEWSGFMATELRAFPDPALLDTQDDLTPSLALEPELRVRWNDGADQLVFQPFYRFDGSDPERTHGDIRELHVTHRRDAWEWTLGISKVFWGTTESEHLIDIINQADMVEDIDGESRLGQPMVALKGPLGEGAFELYALIGHRERTFPGEDGRLWLPIDVDHPVFEDSRERLDWAARVSQTFASFDVGLGWFHGMRRDPELGVNPATGLATPVYNVIDQISLDVQGAWEQWLFKLEAFHRATPGDDYQALVTGFEYTLNGVFHSHADLGLLLEYAYDGRANTLETAMQNDLFGGLRIMLNDQASSSVLAGAVLDLEQDSLMWRIEASRRLGTRWKLAMELQGFPRTNPGEPIYYWRRDGYLRIQLQRWF